AGNLSSDGASRRSVGADPPLSGEGEAELVERDDEEQSNSPWPDLVLIDGGQGQLTAARETLSALGVTNVPLIGMAKGPERDAGREPFFMAGREPFPAPALRPVRF